MLIKHIFNYSLSLTIGSAKWEGIRKDGVTQFWFGIFVLKVNQFLGNMIGLTFLGIMQKN